MIENDEIRTQVAAKSVDTLFENVDVEAAIAEHCLPRSRDSLPFSRGWPARAQTGRRMLRSSGHVCRRCGWR